ncbi:helix-turn-helix domain-containing protein [Halorientalis sp.]|uniref:helix-turn-helix domain-containing protein n=1 Tax=Halorientalis sp. TaxID=1931229 RepID=UPI00261074E7|nr:helix-turn-helix domain-containing protein [Halorientalis sp.]
MRHVTVRLSLDAPQFHPFVGELLADPVVSVQRVHRADLLDDGTLVVLAEGTGDRGRFESIVQAADPVRECSLSGERTWYAYLSVDPTEFARTLLQTRRSSDVFVKWPVGVVDQRTVEVTYVGHDSGFREKIAALPETIDVEIVRTGTSYPDAEQLLEKLTERQREIFTAAVEQGYYADPRRTTHKELAEELGCSAANIGEHLRKIEATVFRELRALDRTPGPTEDDAATLSW